MNIGIFGLLTILFVLLKAFNYIDWSWWLVFSPLIFSFIITVILLILAGIAAINK